MREQGHASADGARFLWVALIPLSAFLALAWELLQQPLPWNAHWNWVPSLGVELAFRVDGLSAQMLALITGIGALIFVYASGYLAHEARRGRLFLLLTVFMAAMCGAVVADHLLLLFLFWELTSLASFLLVGWHHEQEANRAAARQALLITLGGGLALLAGFLLLAEMADTWLLSELVTRGPLLAGDPRLPAALMLVLIGCFTKSAQFPFHFWLPNAMAAPTPVSAYLHSATLVKLGIYLLARLDPAFNELPLWEFPLIAIGTLTALWGAVLSLQERDLKRILAWSTVSALGTLTLLIGLPGASGGAAVVAFLFAHALYKAPLFMVAGNIDHATGSRSIDHLMGLRRYMPGTTLVAVLAGLSMAGLPLSFGFVAKDVMAVAKADADLFAIVGYATLLINAVAVAVAGVAAIRVFWGPPQAPREKVHEVPWQMWLPPLLLALIGLEFELLPNLADPLLAEAALAISPQLGALDANAVPASTAALSATAITLGLGALLFLAWDRLHRWQLHLSWLDRFGPASVFARALHGVAALAARHTRTLQHGRLASYLASTLAALLLLGGLAATDLEWTVRWDRVPQNGAWLLAIALIVSGAAAAVFMHGRLSLLMASGLVGYGSAVLFLFTGAPDLAFTQFAVETVLVVVAASVLPHFRAQPPRLREHRLRNALLALAAGLGVFLLLMNLFGNVENRQLADWFAAASLPLAHGRNVVNVIIVDFRALDTLGEIAVVAFSLLAALPLLAGLRAPVASRGNQSTAEAG